MKRKSMKRKSRSRPKRSRRSPRYNQMVQTMDEDCPVCFEPLGEGETNTLGCGHIFHQTCINRLRDRRCPLCRAPIPIDLQQV